MSVVFDKYWFEQHQSKLLWFLNHWFLPLRWLSRKIVGTHDFPFWTDIYRLEPNCHKIKYDKGIRAVFHPKACYAKQIYHRLYWVWFLLHAIDMLRIPKLNFGFDTLTAYPDANPETDTVDGHVYHDDLNSNWNPLVGAAGNAAGDADYYIALDIWAGNQSNKWDRIRRGIMLFDTSTIGTDSTINSATCSLYKNSLNDSLSIDPNVNIFSSSPASNTALVSGDYDSLGSTAFATDIASSDVVTDDYTDWTLNATGIAAIEKTGITKFGIRDNSYDVPSSAPTWSNYNVWQLYFWDADAGGIYNGPKLYVDYTPAASGSRRIFIT